MSHDHETLIAYLGDWLKSRIFMKISKYQMSKISMVFDIRDI